MGTAGYCLKAGLRRCEQFARDDPSRARAEVEEGAAVHGLLTAQRALACRLTTEL